MKISVAQNIGVYSLSLYSIAIILSLILQLVTWKNGSLDNGEECTFEGNDLLTYGERTPDDEDVEEDLNEEVQELNLNKTHLNDPLAQPLFNEILN